MGFLDTLADILTREPKKRPEFGPMSDALAAQAAGYGVTGGLLNAIDPYILNPMASPEHQYVRDTEAALRAGKKPAGMSRDAMERVGMAGIFAGPGAKTADLVALKRAEEMAAKGADNEAVRQATGWFKGMDGKWRFEIPDNLALINENVSPYSVSERSKIAKFRSSDVLPHKQLYDAYPELGKIDTYAYGDSPIGGGSYSGDMIQVGNIEGNTFKGAGDAQRSTLLHELQHAIQEREGFARGGSPDHFLSNSESERMYGDANILKRLIDGGRDMQRAKERFKAFVGREPELGAESVAISGMTADQMLAQKFKTPHEQYQNLAGEIEARDVSARMNLTPEQRLATPPDLRPDAIVRYGNGISSFLPYD